MELTHLRIKNFRNFKELDIDLTNKNIIFGLNDIGKSNLLSAIRFLFDRIYRREGFQDTDYFNKLTNQKISITITINIEDEDDDDNKKIYKMMRGAINSEADEIFIRLESEYDDKTLVGEASLFWGSDIEDLEAVPSTQSFFELDKYFNVIYIDSSIKLEAAFKNYTKEILKGESSLTDEERKRLNRNINNLNNSVSELKTIKSFEKDLKSEYIKYRDESNFNLSIKSEIELGNIYSKLTPYILSGDCETYPTSGDGRKKILAYTLLTLENRKNEEKKINVFLIEELENHLHRSMQIALSYQIFGDEIFKHLFLTTHSSLVVSQMDDVNLIKLFGTCGVSGKSYCYSVPEEYKKLKHKLNQSISEAIYADVVLLVEGPSEKILFERILNEKCERYESLGGYILQVDGINFRDYYDILKALGITVIIKTDNDLKLNAKKSECNLLGINRCQSLLENTKLANIIAIDIDKYDKDIDYKKSIQIDLYDNKHNDLVSNFADNNIYLSRIDLENDLYVIIPTIMDRLSKDNNSNKNGIDYLQSAKLINMIDLCKTISTISLNKIYNHELFRCVKELVDKCC